VQVDTVIDSVKQFYGGRRQSQAATG